MKLFYATLFLFFSMGASAQQLTRVCIVDHNDQATGIDSAIELQYIVNTNQGSFTLDAIKMGDCFTLNYDNISFGLINSIELLPTKDVNPVSYTHLTLPTKA